MQNRLTVRHSVVLNSAIDLVPRIFTAHLCVSLIQQESDAARTAAHLCRRAKEPPCNQGTREEL